MKYSFKIASITFITTLVLFALIGIVGSDVSDLAYIVGSLVISLLVSVVTYLFVSLYLHFFVRNNEIPLAIPQTQNPSTPSIPRSNRHILKVIFIVVIVMIPVIIFISSNSRDNISSDIEIQNESLPEFNFKIRNAQKVFGLKGQVANEGIGFNGDFYLVTIDGQNKSVYKLREGSAKRVIGLPDQFYAIEFKPVEKGLVVIVWTTEAKNVNYYLITDTTATKITNNYPPELYVDKVFGNGKIKVGLTDNNSEKKISFLDKGKLFGYIDIHNIKYPDILVVNDAVLTNTIIPQTYIASEREFPTRDGKCGYKIYYLNDQNPSLQEIQTTQNLEIKNICNYLVIDKTLWFTTRTNDAAELWKLNKRIATKVGSISLDDVKYYDNDATAYNFKIAPRLEAIDNIVMVNTGKNRYVLDGDKLKHVQNIAFEKVGSSGQLIARIKDYLFAGCSDADFARFRLCKYDLSEIPVQEKYIGTIDRVFISPYKSLYDDQYYITGVTELATTKYYHLNVDKLTRVNKEVTTIIYPNKYNESNHIDFIRKGLIDRYQIPNQYQFSEYETGSDAGGSYYLAGIKGTYIFDELYYLPKD